MKSLKSIIPLLCATFLTEDKPMKYDLTKPCDLCPFRNDEKRLYVAPSTLAGMAAGEFCCHKTGVVNEEGTAIEPTDKSQHCAGALIMLEKMEQPHQMMRICERLGMYDRRKLDMDAPVFGSFAEVRKAEKNNPFRKPLAQVENRARRYSGQLSIQHENYTNPHRP
jgi:hypothetical protein